MQFISSVTPSSLPGFTRQKLSRPMAFWRTARALLRASQKIFLPAPSLPARTTTAYCRLQLRSFSFAQPNYTAHSISSTTVSPYGADSELSHFEYNWICAVEPLEKYRPGGYHPVMVGDILHGRYKVVDKLGFGGYSTIWLAQDTSLSRYVAVKISIAGSSQREIIALRALHAVALEEKECSSIPTILDEFEVHGPNGTHQCYAMVLAQCNIREASFSRLFPVEVARALSAAVVTSVASIHSRGYIHGDIHLRNILVKLPSSFDELSIDQLYEKYGRPEMVPITERSGKPLPLNVPSEAVTPLYLGKYAEEFSLADTHVLLSDFGEAFNPDLHPRLGKDCRTPLAMRPPEARFEPYKPLSYAADIWSLATAIWEIIGMKAVFSCEFVTADDVTAQQIDVLGTLPLSWWEDWKERGRFFDESGRPKEGREVWPSLHVAFEEGVQKFRRKLQRAGKFSDEETTAILNLLRRMLMFRPEERPTIEEVLESEWMVKWALPDFNRRP